MAPLIDLVNEQLDPRTLSQISNQLGIDENQTRQAVPAALTALLGGLSHNASQPQGAQQLAGALSRDHDGSILDNLGGFLGGGAATGVGASILGHIFGRRQPAVATTVGRTTGLDPGTVTQLLMLLAPIVLGALGRRQRQQGLDPGGLAGVLGEERRQAETSAPAGLGGLLGRVLDSDGDGQIMDDVGGLLGGVLGGGRR